MRIFTVIAAAAGLVLSVAVAYAHEPPEWTSDVKDDGGPPDFVDTAAGTADEDAAVDEDTATDEDTTRARRAQTTPTCLNGSAM